MSPALKSLIVAGCGLATALLTGIVVTVVEHTLGFSIHTLAVWFVIPAGALMTGLASASGFYFGSLYLHARPTKFTLVQVVVVGGLSYFLIHYISYFTLVLNDGVRARDVIGFGDFLDFVLTKSHYRVGRGAGTDIGEMGRFGYALGGLQVLGFLAGGFWSYVILKNHPACEECSKFLRPLGTSQKEFEDNTTAADYHDKLFGLPLDSPDFASLASANHKTKAKKGAVTLTMKLFGCPNCKQQALKKLVQVCDGRNWKEIDSLTSLLGVPAGVSLVPSFRKKK